MGSVVSSATRRAGGMQRANGSEPWGSASLKGGTHQGNGRSYLEFGIFGRGSRSRFNRLDARGAIRACERFLRLRTSNTRTSKIRTPKPRTPKPRTPKIRTPEVWASTSRTPQSNRAGTVWRASRRAVRIALPGLYSSFRGAREAKIFLSRSLGLSWSMGSR